MSTAIDGRDIVVEGDVSGVSVLWVIWVVAGELSSTISWPVDGGVTSTVVALVGSVANVTRLGPFGRAAANTLGAGWPPRPSRSFRHGGGESADPPSTSA
ncbi:MAG: hypothetical protein R2705_01455 [Ilumatobacteraceae bacterium]